ncbi:hypothetical protein ACE103_30070 [Bradyrhizobium sp. ma5]|uniref:hypothetical protein n=1 Tax=Bradyrhizobium sp. ma5 TaxID=3344828 RepID=UPI0035D4A16D
MPNTFTHRGVTFTVTHTYDDVFKVDIHIGGRKSHHTVRTRLVELARRRAETLINRKLKERPRPV